VKTALDQWLIAAAISEGAIFRRVSRTGKVWGPRITKSLSGGSSDNAAADRSERSSRIIVGVLAILAVVAFIWMHLHMFPPETLGGLLQVSVCP
jgi:hypothetical protein